MALVVESGCFEKVLWQQVSHLLLKYTKSGYGTVLTAACARQGSRATEYAVSYFLFVKRHFVVCRHLFLTN
jgi:hypothetical protein